MNGGNRTRGQADGFGLEILPKLKDVKSRVKPLKALKSYKSRVISITLLLFIYLNCLFCCFLSSGQSHELGGLRGFILLA